MKINTLFCFSIVKNEHFNHFFRAMKICTVLLFVCVFQLLATQTDAQNATIRVNTNVITIGQLLKEIEQQTDYLVVYRNREVDTNHKVRIRSKSAQVKDYLNNAFADTDIDYQFENNYIVLSKKNEQGVVDITIDQQSGKKITGTVLDDMGDPVAGANVVERGTTNGVITDFNGSFTLNVAENAVLVVSYIGYRQQTVSIAGKTTVDIILAEDTQALDEVVVVGYGTQKKINLTGSVAQIGSKVLENRPITSSVTALQGALPGVFISPSSGDPNANVNFNIRGTTSINGGDPLVLVDGMESSLKLVNPNDIESVTTLKDAAASAIYGVRAAFGVILITTKKGSSETKTTINYNGSFSWQKATVSPELVGNSYDHASFINASMVREGLNPLYDADQITAIEAYYRGEIDTDWYIKNGTYYYNGYVNWADKILNDYSPKQQHNLSISGGNGKTTFYASAAYVKQEGVFKISNDKFDRLNTRLTIDHQAYDWMKFGMRMVFNQSENNKPFNYAGNSYYHSVVFSSPVRGGMWMGSPDYPEYDHLIGYSFQDQDTEVYLKNAGREKDQNTEILVSPSVDFTPLKNWNIHVDFNYRRSNSDLSTHKKKVENLITNQFVITEGSSSNNYYQKQHTNTDYYSFNAFTDYAFNLYDKHDFKVLAGFNQELTKYYTQTALKYGMLSLNTPSLTLGTGDQTVSESGYEWALRGGFARINYEYDNRYLLELVGRYDGTSRFPKDDRFVFAPSFSLGWRISEENFMSFVKPMFNSIKLRGSYGVLGNQMLTSTSWSGNTKYYPYIAFMTSGTASNYLFNNTTNTMISPSGLIPSGMTWEKVSTLNGGIDLVLLNNRLDLTFEVYERITSDMLTTSTYPEVLGGNAPVMNHGELTTKGWELSVNWRDRIGDFNYSLGLNLFDAQAEITKWDASAVTIGNSTTYYKGMKIGEIWGYETEGLFQTQEEIDAHPSQRAVSTAIWAPGDVKLKDLNGDGVINYGTNTLGDTGDRKIIGNTTSRYNYGIRADMDYKGVFLNLYFNGVGKRDFMPGAGSQAFWPVGTQYYGVQKIHFTDSWTEDNPNAYFPIARARSQKNYIAQTRYLQDASFIRLKNLTVGYDLPQRWIQKVRLSKAQIYFSGENLWETNHIKGAYDPETASNLVNTVSQVYPIQRVYSFGVSLTY